MKITYPAPKQVAIWVGNFDSEIDFDREIDLEVSARLALSDLLESICEITFEPEALDVRDILDGFSGSDTFLGAAMDAAREKKIGRVNAALVCYYVNCTGAPEFWGKLRFIGNFTGQDN